MKYKGYWSRWHRFDANGIKQIKKFEINETPNPLQIPGYTEWRRGCGPLSPEHYENVVNAVRAFAKGRPKTPEQIEKMRLAKLGKPKSLEHRENMKKAWARKRLEKPNLYKNIFNEFDKTNNEQLANEA